MTQTTLFCRRQLCEEIDTYEEILKYFGEMSEDDKKEKEDRNHMPKYPQMQEKCEKIFQRERNRDRKEYRWKEILWGMTSRLALLRKFADNILRIAMLAGDCSEIMTEAMDDFSDDQHLREKHVFNGIAGYY